MEFVQNWLGFIATIVALLGVIARTSMNYQKNAGHIELLKTEQDFANKDRLAIRDDLNIIKVDRATAIGRLESVEKSFAMLWKDHTSLVKTFSEHTLEMASMKADMKHIIETLDYIKKKLDK